MGHFFIRLHNGNLKHSTRVGTGKMFNGPELVHSLPDIRKGWVRRKFTQVEFYVSRNFSKFSSVQFFLSHAQEIYGHNECCMFFFKALGLWSYAVYVFSSVLIGSSNYFLLDKKYVSTILILHRPSKIYASRVLLMSGTD